MKAVEDAIDDAKALVETIVDAVENVIDAINSIPEALEQLDEMIAEFVESLGEDIVAELKELGEELLADLLDAADALATEGIETLAELVEGLLNDLVDAIEYQLDKAIEAFEKAYLDATTGEYGVGCDSYYVSLGDAAVLSKGDSYADILADELEVKYAELADAALTTTGIEGYVAANAEEIAKADLITVSLGTNDISGFVLEQVEAYINGADTTIDWTALNLDKEIMDVLFGALSETHAFLAEQLADAETVDLMGLTKVDPVELVTLMVDSYLYGTLSFSLNFAPALNAIHAANPEAHVVVVGMSNPFEAIVDVMGIEDLDINAVLDAVTSITNLEFLVYTMLTPNTTFVPAPEAESNLTVGAQLGSDFAKVFELAFQTSEAGHAYIAERILNALTVGTEDHVYGEWVSISDEQHQRTCGLCGVAFETEDHEFGQWITNGTNHIRVCEVCDYIQSGEHADADNDHNCDICGDKFSDCADANGDHKCDICGTEVSEHADANNDHKCDICGDEISEHADANNDHKCDICGTEVSEHTDANGDHKCDICGGDMTPAHSHVFQTKFDANGHWTECACGEKTAVVPHTFGSDNKCECGYTKPADDDDDDHGGSGGGSSKPATKPVKVENPFTDVNKGDYFYDSVLWAVEKDITTGMTDTLFAPYGVCTRAQMVTFLWRAMGSPAPKSTSCSFVDVSADAYYYDAVLWGTENGVIKGTSETTFSPNQTVTRCQTVAFLWRNAGAPKATTASTFTDIVEGAYYYDAVLWAAEEKITKGTSATTFSPEDPCLRGQIVTLMYNYMAD